MLTDKLFTGQREMAGLGIYHYGARFYSPKLGRFLSPDTIVPGEANPQGWNRYSYVLGNPLKYTDPSGHEPKYGCYNSTNNDCTNANGTALSAGNGLKKPKKDKDENKPPTIIDNYCGTISGLACIANAAQDVATLTDLVGVGLIEIPAVAAGCASGGPVGCVIAEVGVVETWNLTLNNVEFVASSVSLAFTVADDLFNNGGLGENSATSSATWAAGLLPLTPSWDLAADTYSSGYNHGIFNSVQTIWTDGLLK